MTHAANPSTGPAVLANSSSFVPPRGELSLQTVAMPSDTNWFGDIFGGWLLGQMDLAGAIAARRRADGRVATIALNDMVFHVPVKVGDVIACYTQIERVGTTSMTIYVEVWEVHDDNRLPVKVTEGRLVYVAIDEHGKKRPVPADRSLKSPSGDAQQA